MCQRAIKGSEQSLVRIWSNSSDRETLDYVWCFPLHFFRALASNCVLYNKTEQSQGFFISVFIKGPVTVQKNSKVFCCMRCSKPFTHEGHVEFINSFRRQTAPKQEQFGLKQLRIK